MKNNNKWNADSEAVLMGFTVKVESKEHLTYMVNYVCRILNNFEEISEERLDEIVTNATEKYNSSKKSVEYFAVFSTMFGNLLTFVRQKKLVKKDGSPLSGGVLAWVENFDSPMCSELGYTFFQNKNGRVVRVS